METKTVKFTNPTLRGELKVPGDKSISHRAVMLGSIAAGKTTISGFLPGEDCLCTIDIFRKLGVTIEREGDQVSIDSPGIDGWKTPDVPLYAGNSGTTARLMLGILAGSKVQSTLTGDAYLSKRPMKRVIAPLEKMGASITGEGDANYLPLTIIGQQLNSIQYEMPIASAQVKSGILFGALQAEGETSVIEKTGSRDHTERMLRQFGAEIETNDNEICLKGQQALKSCDVIVPGDISSAAFFMAAAAIVPESEISFINVGLNPSRTGMIDVMREMGVTVEIVDQKGENGEPYGTVTVKSAKLHGTEIGGDMIPRLIDELPIIALMATQATGKTIIKDAEELRVKETDRIAAVTSELKKLGATVEETEDGMIITGPSKLSGATLQSYGDHRIGMMSAIAALVSDGPVQIEDPSCIAVSYPNFFDDLYRLTGRS
ncbi:3-phosphoshikimate 1-carboxyvinyltransferase [Sporosarcina sp. NCCP-2222]|uniref:3-phosphoshikimate 1-carboxyvinyltransferase n=1 Tax=Sporosarcina sp. NCCP-2222 TaxID=2935073 RepID=UPI002082C3D4|nr:3-phosphoshikimate 1-carboxyvinyltransferase [Sporosarcina sp. NCCP-2222]GKV55429.1 3-phosphoshikimate 1-carboxyvinyltransferase [Sporosarcina sp. NCCP-2222]